MTTTPPADPADDKGKGDDETAQLIKSVVHEVLKKVQEDADAQDEPPSFTRTQLGAMSRTELTKQADAIALAAAEGRISQD